MGDEIVGGFTGAFFGALFALLGTLWLNRRTEMQRITQQLIDEYFSASFMKHRIAVFRLRRKILSGQVSLGSLASGFWYPGSDNPYLGEELGEFNEHQHLELYLSFLIRVAQTSMRGLVDEDGLRTALKSTYLWHADLVNAMMNEARKQIDSYALGLDRRVAVHPINADGRLLGRVGVDQRADCTPRPEMPIWMVSVETVNRIMGYSHSESGMIAVEVQRPGPNPALG